MSRSLTIPVRGIASDDLVSSFHDARGSRRHEAIDILAPRGTDVLAVEDGKVVKLFTSDAGGLTIYQFDPSETFVYYYAHLDRYAPGLKEGAMVREGRCDWIRWHDRKRAEGHASPAFCDLEAGSGSPMVGRDRARSVYRLARSLRKLDYPPISPRNNRGSRCRRSLRGSAGCSPCWRERNSTKRCRRRYDRDARPERLLWSCSSSCCTCGLPQPGTRGPPWSSP